MQIGKKDVLDTDPAADIDTRVVEVKIYLDEASSKKVADLTYSRVIAKINL
jgi:HlyD family secretion protein